MHFQHNKATSIIYKYSNQYHSSTYTAETEYLNCTNRFQ